jgi:16S rRNA (uracil1498-N3)-methyltransferase
MTRRCFFVPEIVTGTRTFDLPPALSRQLEAVLRAKAGDPIELIDGRGSTWEGLITGIRRGRVSVSLIGRVDRPSRESPLAVTLAMGIARPDTMDLIVRQATEMGVLRLAVFRGVRSQYGLDCKSADKKEDRWSRIASEAMCQCGRTKTLEIKFFDDLSHLIAWSKNEESEMQQALRIFAMEREPRKGLLSLRSAIGSDIDRLLAVFGPEGGWDNTESSMAIEAGFTPVSLGPRTLRLETAVIALISSVQLLWGDMGAGP